MAATRVYVVTEDGKPIALIRASSQATAVRHVVKGRFDAAPVDQEMLLDLAVGKGMKVETAGEDKEADAQQAAVRG